MLVNISEIKVKKRVRKDLGDLDALKDSLRRYGLLNPITIDNKNRLIAGERRLEAAKLLGWTNINAVVVNNISAVTKLELELEENNQRKEFTDAELLEGYKRLERLRNPSIFRKILNAIVRFFEWIFEGIANLLKKK
ncbi:MAG: ParB N-terminal domain-containing protein [Treponema sp.]|uniref:ParB N-terminal domain-containing protein n=1 Tax=Treponema sp. TaxID=166 RepID=UPI00298DC438|nr:ParB N-terminal domain-containing protein [Treponema sp.]MCQ2600400.1 ParB N-terminal domain-containing protein [Treponema sp.]